MKRIFILLSCVLMALASTGQVPSDTLTLRTKINTWLVPNGNNQITAQKMNQLFNGVANLMKAYAVDSGYFGHDTLYLTKKGGFPSVALKWPGSIASEYDPTVPTVVKSITDIDIATWNSKMNQFLVASGLYFENGSLKVRSDSALWNAKSLNGNPISNLPPSDGQALIWRSTEYVPETPSSDFLPKAFTQSQTLSSGTYDLSLNGTTGSVLFSKQTPFDMARMGLNSFQAYMQYRDLNTGNYKGIQVGSAWAGINVQDQVNQIGLVYSNNYWTLGKLNPNWIPPVGYVRDIIDSSILAALGTIDTAKENLRGEISLKLNKSDTATMLAGYLRIVGLDSVKGNLRTEIDLRLRKSDTANMLANYLRAIALDSVKGNLRAEIATASANGNTAYSWGNHADAGYLTTEDADDRYYPFSGNPYGYVNQNGLAILTNKQISGTLNTIVHLQLLSIDTALYSQRQVDSIVNKIKSDASDSIGVLAFNMGNDGYGLNLTYPNGTNDTTKVRTLSDSNYIKWVVNPDSSITADLDTNRLKQDILPVYTASGGVGKVGSDFRLSSGTLSQNVLLNGGFSNGLFTVLMDSVDVQALAYAGMSAGKVHMGISSSSSANSEIFINSSTGVDSIMANTKHLNLRGRDSIQLISPKVIIPALATGTPRSLYVDGDGIVKAKTDTSGGTGTGLTTAQFNRMFTKQPLSNPTGTITLDVDAGAQAYVTLTSTGGRTLAFSNLGLPDMVKMVFYNTSGSTVALTLPSNSACQGASSTTFVNIPSGVRAVLCLSDYDGTNYLFTYSIYAAL